MFRILQIFFTLLYYFAISIISILLLITIMIITMYAKERKPILSIPHFRNVINFYLTNQSYRLDIKI